MVELALAEFSVRVPPRQTLSVGLHVVQVVVTTAAESEAWAYSPLLGLWRPIFTFQTNAAWNTNKQNFKLTLGVYKCELTLIYASCFFNFLSHQEKNSATRSGERVWDQWRFHWLWSEALTSLPGSRVWQRYISLLASIGVSAAIVTGFWKRSTVFISRLVDVHLWMMCQLRWFLREHMDFSTKYRFYNAPYQIPDPYCVVTLCLFATAGCSRTIVHPLENNMNQYEVSVDYYNCIKTGKQKF
jgi:hypothetical protein